MALLDEKIGTDISFNGDFRVAADGDLDQITGRTNLKQRLFRRLMTQPGSMTHLGKGYGVGIKDYLNATNSIANQQRLAGRIKEQFEQDIDVESVVGVRMGIDDETPDKMIIFVRVRIDGFGETEMDFVPFNEVVN